MSTTYYSTVEQVLDYRKVCERCRQMSYIVKRAFGNGSSKWSGDGATENAHADLKRHIEEATILPHRCPLCGKYDEADLKSMSASYDEYRGSCHARVGCLVFLGLCCLVPFIVAWILPLFGLPVRTGPVPLARALWVQIISGLGFLAFPVIALFNQPLSAVAFARRIAMANDAKNVEQWLEQWNRRGKVYSERILESQNLKERESLWKKIYGSQMQFDPPHGHHLVLL